MMVLSSNRRYYSYILCLSLILLSISTLLFLFVKNYFYLLLILFLAIEFILLSTKFTQLIRIDEGRINIIYYRFLFKKQICFNISEIKIEADYSGSYRSPKHFILKILIQKEVVYTIDERDGFTAQDLIRIKDVYSI